MKTSEEILKGKLNPSIAILNNPDYTFNKVIEAMEEYANQFKRLHLHSLMQAEVSDGAAVAAVGQRSVGTVTEGLEVTDIKTGQILNVEGYGFMFGRVNTGEIQCFNIGNVSELPRGE